MQPPQITFDDGAAYEEFMGKWSLTAGTAFLQWLSPRPHLKWVDIGCGNGAFTELVVRHCAPSAIDAVDPSPGQLDFAKARTATAMAHFRQADAMSLPYADASFDAAVMALVIFFVPEPARGVAEMSRVVKPGGSVSAYAWDIPGGGFPYAVFQEELEHLGFASVWPPSVDAARLDSLRALWSGAGLVDVDTHVIHVERTFASFDAFWAIATTGPSAAKRMAEMSQAQIETLKHAVRLRLTAEASGAVTCRARANAIRGSLPA